MTALEFSERVPMPIEQSRKDFRFHFALLQLFVALFVARIIFAIGIYGRHEYDILPVRRPDGAVGTGGDRCDLMRFPNKSAAVHIKVAHPDLRWIGRFRCPDQAFAVRRKPRPLFVIRRWITPSVGSC